MSRRLAAEFLGTLLLLATVVGSGVMGDALAQGNAAIALLANAAATAGILYVLIACLGPVSGAHFNPVVTLAAWGTRSLPGRDACCFLISQIVGAVAGVALAHVMFNEPVYAMSTHARPGWALLVSEATATFGLIAVIRGPAGNDVSRAAGVCGRPSSATRSPHSRRWTARPFAKSSSATSGYLLGRR